METRWIGSLEVSAVGLGCNQFGRRLGLEETRACVDAALESGVTFFDTADVYGSEPGRSEELLGQVLEGRRDRVVLATKFGMDRGEPGPRGSRDYVRRSIEQSLARLRTDVIDLYQYHEPDGQTSFEETIGALRELVDEGKVREFGCSNFTAEQLRETDGAFASIQNEHSLLVRDAEAGVIPECERTGAAFIPYFPLAKGLLTGKYRRGEEAPEGTRLHGRGEVADDATFDRLEQLAEFAAERGAEPAEVAVAWLVAQPTVASVIAGATKGEQIRSNAGALRWRPSADDLAELDRIFPPQPS
jgi:aryl-alcohol dehydrogenase-like predicted oxidoreductase